MPHIFTGAVARAPIRYGQAPGWYHVDCYVDARSPVAISTTREQLDAGGGTRLAPGRGASIYGEGVWVCGVRNGMLAVISIEQREQPTYVSVDPRAELSITASAKAHRMLMTPNEWRPFSTGVIGMYRFLLRSLGGCVWFGTHLDTTKPPTTENPNMGDAWPIFPSDPPLAIDGNGNYYAFTFEEHVELVMLKITAGYDIVRRPTGAAASMEATPGAASGRARRVRKGPRRGA